MKESKDISWINRIKDLLIDNPKDKKDLISLLETAAEDNLITQDSYQMILGCIQRIRNTSQRDNDSKATYDSH
jgi:Mg2+/Co2+ transporter CorC